MIHTSLRLACVAGLLLSGCAERKAGTAPPDGEAGARDDRGAPSSAQCPGGGPSVSINIRGYAGGSQLPPEALGALLGWIGGFVQPCLEATPEAPQLTLDITLPEAGQAPTFELVDRASLPGLAACLEANFAKAPAPPPEPMIVEITVPWGCPTLGPGAAPSGTSPTPPDSSADAADAGP